MREIKFRAWDKKRKQWIFPGDIRVNGDGTQWFDCRAEYGGDIIETTDDRDCILMQHTGLKDETGREVYEGDLIQVDPPVEYGPGVVGWEGEYGRWCIVWHWDADNWSSWWGADACATGKIIGNIYENSELLKAKE